MPQKIEPTNTRLFDAVKLPPTPTSSDKCHLPLVVAGSGTLERIPCTRSVLAKVNSAKMYANPTDHGFRAFFNEDKVIVDIVEVDPAKEAQGESAYDAKILVTPGNEVVVLERPESSIEDMHMVQEWFAANSGKSLRAGQAVGAFRIDKVYSEGADMVYLLTL
jgi:hypothetical protein